jgi:hypothetical protein
VGLALVLKVARSVRGWWSAAGGSDAVPRHGLRGGSYPEIDDELGARPRPTIPNDKVSTSGAPLLRFTKPLCGDGAVSTSGMLASVAPLLGVRRGGGGLDLVQSSPRTSL